MSNTHFQKKDVLPIVIFSCMGIVLIFSVLAGLGLIYSLGRNYLIPKSIMTLEPDYSQISSSDIDPSVLEQTAEILTTRSHSLGYPTLSFVVTDDSQIVGRSLSYLDTNNLYERISPIGLIEFVDFGNTPIPEGTVVSTDLENTYLKHTDEKQWHTIMTNSGIRNVSVTNDPNGGYQIAFLLTDDGKKIFTDHTKAHTGTYLGIVMDKVIISMPVINTPIVDGQGVISGHFSQETANELAVRLRTTPLPIPVKLIQDAESDK